MAQGGRKFATSATPSFNLYDNCYCKRVQYGMRRAQEIQTASRVTEATRPRDSRIWLWPRWCRVWTGGGRMEPGSRCRRSGSSWTRALEYAVGRRLFDRRVAWDRGSGSGGA
jgi:hypothetical protein